MATPRSHTRVVAPDLDRPVGGVKYLREHAVAADYLVQMTHTRVRNEDQSEEFYTPGLFVDDRFVETLRIPMQLGTGLSARAPGPQPAVVISDRTWRRVFDGDPDVVGRTAILMGVEMPVLGVMGSDFDGLGVRQVGFLVPIDAAPGLVSPRQSTAVAVNDEHACCVAIAGRVRDGYTRAQAEGELQRLTTSYRATFGKRETRVLVNGTAMMPAAGLPVGMAPMLGLLVSGLLLVLVLTCANVGNLYLARSLRRQREIVLRLSLGASRRRVVRQLLIEGLLLASIAGAGAYATTVTVPIVMAATDDWPRGMFAPDWRVGLLTALVATVACLLVSLAPALQTTRVSWRGASAMLSGSPGRLRGIVLAA